MPAGLLVSLCQQPIVSGLSKSNLTDLKAVKLYTEAEQWGRVVAFSEATGLRLSVQLTIWTYLGTSNRY